MEPVHGLRDLDGNDPMSRPFRYRLIRTTGFLFSAVLLVVVLFWLRSPSGEVEVSPTADGERTASRPVDRSPDGWQAAAFTMRSRGGDPPSPPDEIMADGVKVMGPGNSDSTANGPRHPHPLTPEHESLFRENRIIASLNGAMDVGDFNAMRKMNREYGTEYPESTALQEGYDIIADCIEQESPRRRARAEHYYDEKRASTVRRYVRRYCLEPLSERK
jgi:hypothetical protein